MQGDNMQGLNETRLIGNLGRDPKFFPAKTDGEKEGSNMVSFTVATNYGYGDAKKTEWHNVTAYGKKADQAMEYLKKGSLVCVTGRNRTRKTDSGYFHDVVADDILFLGGNVGNGEGDDTDSDDGDFR